MENKLDFEVFKILSDDNRLRMIVLLVDSELCMTHIYKGLDLKQSNTSRNLKLLEKANVVSIRINGNNRYYKIADDFEKEYVDIMKYLKKLKKSAPFSNDYKRAKSIKNCGCGEDCECKLL